MIDHALAPRRRRPRRACGAATLLLCAVSAGAVLASGAPAAAEEEEAAPETLPKLDPFGTPYRRPRSGEGFEFELLGETHRVPPRDRRSLQAWDLGVAVGSPGVDEGEVLPFASLYFWEHPDDDLLRTAPQSTRTTL